MNTGPGVLCLHVSVADHQAWSRTRNGTSSFETRRREIRPTLDLHTEHDVFGLIPHHLEDHAHGGGVIQDLAGRVGPTRGTSFEHRFCYCRLVYFSCERAVSKPILQCGYSWRYTSAIVT